ncbi:ABC transporter substrate-binding protein [Arthrobacter sp. AQ5-05]|uniref:ABC transporter substrate-binding protein n=1 Tax=Arthrobacter sp. AQ5-05 TaxID=2184581 RepID=UPI0012B603C1|nr:extracellular solute-binding protein [Arthrobacter sp. AQ5-05]
MKNTTKKAWTIAAAALAAGIALSGCSGSATIGSGASTGATTEKVTMDFWGWAPGYKEAIDIWNKQNPNTQVKFNQTPSGVKSYPKVFTAVQAGNAPCLAQIGYESLPNFVVQGAAQDISKYTKGMDSQFTPAGWKSVSIADGVYGIPVDTAPMALLYRKDLFEQYGITAPKTWEDYKADAAKVKAADPTVSLGYFSNDATFWAGVSRQAGASWFTLNKDSWGVHVNDAATKKVAAFWQSMIDDGSITSQESYTPALYKQMAEGKILSEPFGLWDTAVIAQNVPSTSGKWAVAPLPVWTDSPQTNADMGGSSTAVLKGCKTPEAAVKFAQWMSTDPASVKELVSKGGLWPASVAGLSNPVVDQPVPFFGNSPIYAPFKDIAKNMKYDWQWGPVQTELNTEITNSLVKASKDNPIPTIIDGLQEKATSEIKAKGLTVK